MALVNVKEIARPYLDEVAREVAALKPATLKLVGILGTGGAHASDVYAGYAAQGCAEVGIEFEPRTVTAEQVSGEIFRASEDPEVHGILVFYPVFGGIRDRTLQNEVAEEKDVEGLHAGWTRRLYNDVRYVDSERTLKAILPCTPLGILKALRHLGRTRTGVDAREAAEGLTVTIFNRSEVVGRPLAAMLAHDGAKVFSFDVDGPRLYHGLEITETQITRKDALAQSEVVISGVPSRKFQPLRPDELRADASVIDFSHIRNVEKGVGKHVQHLIRRVGPLTIAMLLRNTLRLYRNFHTPE